MLLEIQSLQLTTGCRLIPLQLYQTHTFLCSRYPAKKLHEKVAAIITSNDC